MRSRSAPDVESWNGPYLKGSRVPLDPWGHAYHHRVLSDPNVEK